MDSSAADVVAPVRAVRRPHAAFTAFFESTWPDLAGYCAALLRDRGVAEEVAQETMTRVFVRYPLLSDARPYAFRIATNLVHAHWRQQQRTVPVESFGAFDQPAPAGSDVALLAAVRALAAPLREVVLLHYYADLRVEDVARVLHRPVGTIKRRLHEARAVLARTAAGETR